jgi:hypothetical protein
MRLILPSDFGRKCIGLGILMMLACRHAAPAVPPGEPIPAPPDVGVGDMDAECDGLIAAITTYGACPNAEDDLKHWTDRVAEVARQDFDASKQGHLDEPSRHVIALACHKAAVSIGNATIRCKAGKPPKVD